ncbi:MAG: tetratricopeptide repeat protein [Deltaproteobacteria bacterium]|nr:tetratricopeptide repeat protein [Deltaproteobacteria bacterium]
MKGNKRFRAAWLGTAAAIGGLMVLGACEDGTTGPQVPTHPTSTPAGMPYVPKPGTGGPQYGVADPAAAIEGATQMNAQAAAIYNQGMAAFAQGDLKQAQAFFKQATEADSEAFQAFYSLGVVQERLGSGGAASSYKKAFTLVPKYERAMVAYGLYLAKTGKLSKADSFLNGQRGKNPKSAMLTAAHAEVKSLQKDTATAQELAQEALKLDPAHAAAMMTIARDHYRNRRLDLSLYALKAVLDGFGADNPPRDKDNAEGHLLRAHIWYEQDKRNRAMNAFEKALELRPDLVVPRLRLAQRLLESGGALEALPMLQDALKYDADNLNAHLSLGDAYRLTGQFAAAKQEFEWVKTRDSSIAEVHYNLGLLYMFAPKLPGLTKKKQINAAIKSFNEYKELKGKAAEESDVDDLLAQAKLKKDELDALEAASKPKPVPVPAPDAGAVP